MKAKAIIVLFILQVSRAVSADEGGGDTVQEDSGQ